MLGRLARIVGYLGELTGNPERVRRGGLRRRWPAAVYNRRPHTLTAVRKYPPLAMRPAPRQR